MHNKKQMKRARPEKVTAEKERGFSLLDFWYESIMELPDDCLRIVFEHLNQQSQHALSLSSTRLHRLYKERTGTVGKLNLAH
jgi:hypothetical protein